MRIFDASAIINLCGARKVDRLMDGCTLSLALYEVGNAVWRLVYRDKKVAVEDGRIILDSLSSVIGAMELVEAGDALDILGLAVEEGLTYYDAAYLHAAIKNSLILVTDDETLYRSAKKHVKIIKSEEI